MARRARRPAGAGRRLSCLVVGAFQAYIAGLSLESGAAFGEVFRLTGTVGVLGYAMTHVTDSIWKGVGWSITVKFIIDGIVYGLASAAVFAWLWPQA